MRLQLVIFICLVIFIACSCAAPLEDEKASSGSEAAPVNWISYWNNWFKQWLWGNDVPKENLGNDDRKWFAHAKIYADDE